MIKSIIHDLFENHHIRLTPSNLKRKVCRLQPGCSPKAVLSSIKELVADGTLQYTSHFNTTHLELNFCKPVRISQRIVLMPQGHTCDPSDDGIRVIRMIQGGAFGIGDHPTTRLALRAVDRVMAQYLAQGLLRGIRALDIGTGSGVLAMAAAGLGAEEVLALDIDHLALHEARRNIHLNKMEKTIVVTDEPVENLAGVSYDLIMANLRPPTLKQILPRLQAVSSPNCHWIISGFRCEAMDAVVCMLPSEKTTVMNRDSVCGWAAITVRYLH